MGGDLVIIKSAVQDQFVFELIRNSDLVSPSGVWLGLERVSVNATKFHWIESTPLEGRYENWADGEPNNSDGKEGCVHMYGKLVNSTTSGKWNDFPCGCFNNLVACPVILCQRPLP